MKVITRRTFAGGIALLPSLHFTAARAQTSVTPAEARAIVRDAYIYGFPMVDSYRIQHAYFVDRNSPEFKAPWNQIVSTPHVYTPADTAIQTPNPDTSYSFVGMDLRAEPIVLTVPVIEKNAISASSSSTPTRSTLPTSAVATPATMATASLSSGRTGKARPPSW
jgi:hypothetical protein